MIHAEHRSLFSHLCNTPNEKSRVLKNGPFRPRGVAKIEKMSATLGDKEKKTTPVEHRNHFSHFCNTPNEKAPLFKNGPFRRRGVAKIEKMSATLGEKEKKRPL